MRQYMLRERIGLLLLLTVLFAGCAPTNAEEFRKAIRSAAPLITTVDSFEVARSFKEVTATLRQKSQECLDATVRVVCTNCINSGVVSKQIWKPTFIAKPDRTELDLQFFQFMRADFDPTKDSLPGDHYEFVLDAVPLDKNRTKIDIYRRRPNAKFIHNAMRGWVKGDNMGCPDLSTFH